MSRQRSNLYRITMTRRLSFMSCTYDIHNFQPQAVPDVDAIPYTHEFVLRTKLRIDQVKSCVTQFLRLVMFTVNVVHHERLSSV